MTWAVNYADHAKWDLRGIYEFISDMLLEPIAAKTQTDRIMNAADSLAHFPLRCPYAPLSPRMPGEVGVSQSLSGRHTSLAST